MILAVISDLHDNVTAWNRIRLYLTEHAIMTLINCGDTAAPAMLQEMSRTFAGQIHTVYGNVADRELEKKVVADLTNLVHHGDRGGLDLDGRAIGFNHFPEVAEAMAATGEFDLVCHGHTHLKRWEKLKETYVLNPGTAGGMFQYPSFATIELTTMRHQFQEITL